MGYLDMDIALAVRMYIDLGPQLGVPQFHSQPPTSSQPNEFGNAFNSAASGLIQRRLGAYGEKIVRSSSEYVQSNVCNILTFFNLINDLI